ncbi:MAG: 50S ribosomal protein L10 [Desulfobacterales bacterium]
MKLDEKKKIVEELHEQLAKSKVVIVTDYKGLNVETMTELRRKLREEQIDYRVVKNTLLIRAAKETGVALIQDQLKGPSAIALSFDDPVAPAKVLMEFAKKNEKLEIKAGVMEDRVLDLSAIKALAALPPREVLLSQLLSAMVGVPTGLVRVLNGIPQKLMYALQAIKDQKEAA